MVTLNEQVAQECIYSLPRKEKDQATGQWVIKPIEGPSARFAEVVASAWGNSRAGARVVNDQGDFVTAQGVFHDLERNVAITYEVQRRITNSRGERYKADMIGVTANAACSIALRNAILKGVPKAFWADMYDAARQAAIGNVQTLAARRSRALAVLQKMGVQQETVFAFLKIAGIEDITLEHLGTLFGITQALKEGDTTPELAFALDGADAPGGAKPRVNMPQARPDKPAAPAAPPAGAPVDQSTGEIDAGGGPPWDGPGAAPAASPAIPPAPTPSSAPNGALATAGERQMILNRCRSNGMEMAVLMEQAGVSGLPADLAGLTKDGFIALKDALPKTS